TAQYMANSKARIIVLGAGISGLSAAYYLHKKLPGIKIDIWDSQNRVGGVIHTVHKDGFQIEQSVDNFITTVPWALNLCKELGLENQLTTTSNQYRRTFVVYRKQLHPLPDGFMMMAPTRLWPMALTPLLSPFGKIRCGLELFLPRLNPSREETLAEFVTCRLGKEAFDRIVEPLVSGIYGGDASRLSLQATLPRFADMETKYRSLILAMQQQQKAARQMKHEEQSGARYSLFITLRQGLSCLPNALAAHLPPGSIHLNRTAETVEYEWNSREAIPGRSRWKITDQSGNQEFCDAVVMALPTHRASAVLQKSLPELAKKYGRIDHTGTAIVTVAYKNEQVKKATNGMGFVVPAIEKYGIIAGSFSSHKYPHRAPEGMTLLRLFVGGSRTPELVYMPDNELIPRTLAEIRGLLKIEGDPVLVDVARWPCTMPQYYLGHLELLASIDDELKKFPTLALAGNAFLGVGIPTCIKSGLNAADKIVEQFK
ncbi:MAG: protoporphyrinogen oxidase, partial [Thermoguttaceae bacterium]|nr:protoporphyrinogen oxidase [Thermoguttaceae bacterium]